MRKESIYLIRQSESDLKNAEKLMKCTSGDIARGEGLNPALYNIKISRRYRRCAV